MGTPWENDKKRMERFKALDAELARKADLERRYQVDYKKNAIHQRERANQLAERVDLLREENEALRKRLQELEGADESSADDVEGSE